MMSRQHASSYLRRRAGAFRVCSLRNARQMARLRVIESSRIALMVQRPEDRQALLQRGSPTTILSCRGQSYVNLLQIY